MTNKTSLTIHRSILFLRSKNICNSHMKTQDKRSKKSRICNKTTDNKPVMNKFSGQRSLQFPRTLSFSLKCKPNCPLRCQISSDLRRTTLCQRQLEILLHKLFLMEAIQRLLQCGSLRRRLERKTSRTHAHCKTWLCGTNR